MLPAVAQVGSLAYTSMNYYTDASLPGFVKWVMDKISQKDKQPSQPTPGLIAHWIHREFQTNLFGKVRDLGGLGFVAVDMKHKKRGYAKVLVTQWLKDCNEKKQYLAALHPFRPDFYGNMGFGLSSPYYDYTISPASIPKAFTLKVTHVEELVACQNRFSDQRHGMIRRDAINITEQAFKDKGVTRAFGVRDLENVLRGYILFKFETSTAGGLINDLKIVDLVYETTEALFAILQFLREQDDQIRYIKITTQETDLFRLLSDPRSAHTAGEQFGINGCGRESAKQTVALMYKVVNLEKLFSEYFSDRDFNGVDGLKLWIRMEDTLTPEMNPPVLVSFENGAAIVLAVGGDHSSEADAVLDIGVAEFSSLVVGAVSLKVLARYGKAFVSPIDKLPAVGKAFSSEDLPINSVFF
ncbi:acyl-CoA N-acyltransferase [Obelidium mucronatum]|nr:acyl-CoA N-acyltransferase [Obelidium mucronatum]